MARTNRIPVSKAMGLLGMLGALGGGAYGQVCVPVELTKVIPFDTQTLDRFGRSVSVSGDFAIIGAYHDADNGPNAGTAYVYRFNGTTWTRVRKLRPNTVGPEDRFGTSVSIDGDVAIVGAVYAPDQGSRSGAAYIFRYDGTTWRFEAKLLASDGAIDDRFGRAVAIKGDVAVVGAIWDDDNGLDSGSAYIYRHDGTRWVEETKLVASDGAVLDKFGWSVSADTDVVIVGSKWSDVNAIDSGAAYIYRYDGASWIEEGKLAPADGGLDDHFGFSVSISGDLAVAGSTWDGDNGLKAGAAYVYRFDGTTWNQDAKLLADDGAANDRFGYAVSISGQRVLVGTYAHADNGPDSGSAFLFTHDGAGWVQQSELLPADGAAGKRFGRSVAISEDTILVGSYFDDEAGIEAGSAYFFETGCSIPCPVDLNNDGVLNFFDVSAFLTAFSAQDIIADINGDGVHNFFDVSAFLTLFGAGCP